jgi:hypothetical protein
MELWLIGSGAAAQERDLPAASLARANRVFRFASFDCIGGSVPGREWAGHLEGEASRPEQPQGTSNDRIRTMPNFRTVERAEETPLRSPEQKFRVTARGLFDPFEDSVTYMIKGFWPDLRKRAKKRTGGLAGQASTTR